jgi:hypothetical protein
MLLDSENAIVESKHTMYDKYIFPNSFCLRDNYKKCGRKREAKEAPDNLIIIWHCINAINMPGSSGTLTNTTIIFEIYCSTPENFLPIWKESLADTENLRNHLRNYGLLSYNVLL